MAKKLFVGNLAWATTDASLQQFFSQIGPVMSAKVITDKFSGRSKGFGFVEFENDADADKAVQELNEKDLEGRNVSVSEARPMQPRDNNYGGGGGGGYRGGGGNDRNRGGGGYGGGNRGDRGGDRRNSY